MMAWAEVRNTPSQHGEWPKIMKRHSKPFFRAGQIMSKTGMLQNDLLNFSKSGCSTLRLQAEEVGLLYEKSGLDEVTATLGTIFSAYAPLFSVTTSVKARDGQWGVKLFEYRRGKKMPPLIFTSNKWLVVEKKREMWLANMNEPCMLNSGDPLLDYDLLKTGADSGLSVTIAYSSEHALMLHFFPEKEYRFTERDYLIIKILTQPLIKRLKHAPGSASFFEEQTNLGLLKSCPSLKKFLADLLSVAKFDVLTLITGESGVGKDIAARALHEASCRKNYPFIKINCGAIPDTLLDSELFGYEKGAFTGAHSSKAGYFEQANNGTIFLDEVGELSLAAQVRLLHVLEDGSIQRVGGHSSCKSNVRIIAATNRDLWEKCRQGTFREDLCYRLFVCHLHVPPLRERHEDIPLLLWYYLNKQTKNFNLPQKLHISEEEIRYLTSYLWPGNIRELRHTIERALLFGPHDSTLELMRHTYHNDIGKEAGRPSIPAAMKPGFLPLDELIAEHLAKVMHSTHGKIKGPGGAAEILRMDPGTLRYQLKKYGLSSLMKQNRRTCSTRKDG